MQTHPDLAASSFTSFDWLLILLVAISTVAAFMRGIIKTVLSLGGLILGILLGAWNYITLAHTLRQWISDLAIAEIVAFLLILSIVMVLFSVAANLLRKTASTIGLGFFDRLLGGAFGFARGVLFGVAIMMAIAAFVPNSEWIRDSRLAPYFLAGAHAVSFVVPEQFQQQISSGATHLLQQAPELFRPHTLKQPM